MSNPYEQQGRPAANQGGGYQQRPQNNGGGGYRSGGGGGGYQGGGGGGYKGGGGGGNRFQQQKKEWTPEELQNAHFSVSIVVMGNENFPPDIVPKLERVIRAIEAKNVIVRAAPIRGLSKVAQETAAKPELHIPFKNFDNIENPASYFTTEYCSALATRYIPDVDKLPMVIKAIYTSLPRLVFGKNLDKPAQLAIIWSEDGCQKPAEITMRSGFSGHVLKLCASSGIPVINLQQPDAEQRVMQFLEALYVEQKQAHAVRPPSETHHSAGSNPGTYVGTQQGHNQPNQPDQRTGGDGYGNQNNSTGYVAGNNPTGPNGSVGYGNNGNSGNGYPAGGSSNHPGPSGPNGATNTNNGGYGGGGIHYS